MAYSADSKIRVIANVGRQMLTDGGWMIIYQAERISDGKKLFLWTRTILAGTPATSQRVWFYRTRSNIQLDINASARSILVDSQVDTTTFLDDSAPDFVEDASTGRVPQANISNDGGNRMLNTVDTAGNLPFGNILGDGVASYPYAVVSSTSVSTDSAVYTPPKAVANAGFFAPITDFISQNPLTSTVIIIGLVIGAIWAYNEYKDEQKPKKKKRRG